MFDKYITGADFEKRVKSCEAAARDNPERYRSRLIIGARLGRWLVKGVVIISVLPLVALAWYFHHLGWSTLSTRHFIVAGFAVAWALAVLPLLFAHRIDYDNDDLQKLKREDAPDLFAFVEEIRSRLNAPELEGIYLDGELNAAAVQVPTGRYSGNYKNRLIIGLPLMAALDRNELKSVIAHEFGHFIGDHGRDGVLVYRTIADWRRLLRMAWRRGGTFEFIIHMLASRFLPRFMAYSFAFRRDNEFEADAAAASLVGARIEADCQLRLELAGEQLHDNWKALFRSSLELEAPPLDCMSRLTDGLNEACSRDDADFVLRRAYAETSDIHDSHPCLRERLDAVGETLRVPDAFTDPAIGLLGDYLEKALAYHSRIWAEHNAEDWTACRRASREYKQRLFELEEKDGADLTLDECIERADMVEKLHGEAASQWHYSQCVAQYPAEPRAIFALGRHLVDMNDERAFEFLHMAMDLDETAIPAASELAARLAAGLGMEEDCRDYRQLQTNNEKHAEDVLREQRKPQPGDPLRPVSDSCLKDIFHTFIHENDDCYIAGYLFEKPMPEWAERKAIWLAVECTSGLMSKQTVDQIRNDIFESLMTVIDPKYYGVTIIAPDDDWLIDTLHDLPGTTLKRSPNWRLEESDIKVAA